MLSIDVPSSSNTDVINRSNRGYGPAPPPLSRSAIAAGCRNCSKQRSTKLVMSWRTLVAATLERDVAMFPPTLRIRDKHLQPTYANLRRRRPGPVSAAEKRREEPVSLRPYLVDRLKPG